MLFIGKVRASLRQDYSAIPPLLALAEQRGRSVDLLVLAAIGVALLLCFAGQLGRFAVSIVLAVYPGWLTWQTLKEERTQEYLRLTLLWQLLILGHACSCYVELLLPLVQPARLGFFLLLYHGGLALRKQD